MVSQLTSYPASAKHICIYSFARKKIRLALWLHETVVAETSWALADPMALVFQPQLAQFLFMTVLLYYNLI